jgi:hypothetical protein
MGDEHPSFEVEIDAERKVHDVGSLLGNRISGLLFAAHHFRSQICAMGCDTDVADSGEALAQVLVVQCGLISLDATRWSGIWW